MCNKITDFRIHLFFLLAMLSGCVNSAPNQSLDHQSDCSLIEETINFDGLQQYYHLDAFPERSPLIVMVDNKNIACQSLKKFGKPVQLIDKTDSTAKKNKDYLDITKIDIVNDLAMVEFHYKPEGLKGQIKFKKLNAEWAVSESTLTEN